MDDYLKDYFADCATSALVDAENYMAQGRRAKAQDSGLTARYFAAKCKPEQLPMDFETRVDKIFGYR
jgi:hypothetical protein